MWKRTRRFIKRRLLSESASSGNQSRVWLLFLAAAMLAYGSLLLRHGHHLWQRDYFQFYPVFVAGVAFLTVQRFRTGELPPRLVWRIEPVSMFLALATLAFAAWVPSPLLAAISFWLMGNSLLCGNKLARQSWRMLAILIPLPLGNDRWLVQQLQQTSSAGASVLLDTFGVPHLMRGNVLELADRRFFVEEACSGISSVYLLLAATWFCLVWHRTRAIRGIPLLLSVFWWAIVANVLRIFSIAAAHYYWQIDLSVGILHQLTGITVLCVAFGLILLTMQFLDFLFAPIGDGTFIRDNKVSLELTPTVLWNLFAVNDPDIAHGARGKPPFGINIHRKLLLYSLSVFLMIAGTTHLSLAYGPALMNRGQQSDPSTADLKRTQFDAFETLDRDIFEQLDGYRVRDCERQTRKTLNERNTFGAFSRNWLLTGDSGEFHVSIDGPFTGWHDLRGCYEGQGWSIIQTETSSIRSAGIDNLVSVQMIDALGQSATLHFCQFQPNGVPIPVPLRSVTDSLVDTFRNRLNEHLQVDVSAEAWQLQMLVRHSGHVIDAQIPEERQLFEQLLSVTLDHWRESR